ncbi:MAG: helix-turn-helix domain-containing protein [Polyangiaceae bacterium]|nr:helix-turn-helix domain-containing protein [Myxococcales bacterium]MCB9587162.1 helix-turn-helix domain-containing protein [Polyangiaceae bacterium]
MTASEAAALLGIRLPTLYAYASRGKLRSERAPGSARARMYPESEVRRLLRATQARSGHAAAAEGALNWGQPVLSSSITEISEAGPCYRGVAFSELIEQQVPYEAACELLWYGDWGERERWSELKLPRASALGPWLKRIRQVPELGSLEALQLLVPWIALDDPTSHGATAEAERSRGRKLISLLAACLGPAVAGSGLAAPLESQPIASRVVRGILGAPGRRFAAQVELLNAVLIACLDHELNASTFCARVAASAGANLYASISAGLGALSGPRHGRACDRVEALVLEVERPSRARSLVDERARRGEQLPGFGHPLYPHGDPRGRLLLELASRHAKSRALTALNALAQAMVDTGRPGPTLDAGLVGVSLALGLPRGAAAGLFALGRAGGWVAHVLEQREQPELLRPRARYVGAPGRAALPVRDPGAPG